MVALQVKVKLLYGETSATICGSDMIVTFRLGSK